MGFVHLHTHSMDGSLLDGLASVKLLAKRAKELGQDALAITEHGFMGSMVKFYKACKNEGIKPIIGYEAYIVDDVVATKEAKDDHMNHIILLAKNKQGLENILYLNDFAFRYGFYYKPRIDKKILVERKDGLIVCSACLAGIVPRLFLGGKREEAVEEIKWFKEIFKDDYYLEVQDHGLFDQAVFNSFAYGIAEEEGIKLVATNDVHYLNKEDAESHRVLLCNQIKKTKEEADEMVKQGKGMVGFWESGEFYLKSEAEMLQNFKPEILENTIEISNKCEVVLDRLENPNPLYLFPKYNLPKNTKLDSYFKKLCRDGLKKRSEGKNYDIDKYKERLEYEIKVISDMGFQEYFLVLFDILKFCRKKDIPYGPGRGCFIPGSKVLMYNGTVKSIEDVVVSDKVVTHNGEIQEVYGIPNYDINEDMYIIKAGSNEEITTTNDHKFLVLKTRECNNTSYRNKWCKKTCRVYNKCKFMVPQELEWIKAKNIRVGDMLCYPKNINLNDNNTTVDLSKLDNTIKYNDDYVWYERGKNRLQTSKINRYITFDNEFARLAGYYIGNGYSSFNGEKRNYKIGIAFNSSGKQKQIDDVVNLFQNIFGITLKMFGHKTKNVIKLEIGSKILVLFFKKYFGNYALDKHVPDELMTSDKNILKNLLVGLMNTDGHLVSKAQKISYSTISENLAYQVQLIFSKLGYYGNKGRHKRNQNGWHDDFTVSLSGKQLIKLKEDLFPEINIREQAFYRNEFIEDSDYYYFKVNDVKTINYNGKVYDLSVNNNTSYIINSSVVHNSAAGSLVAYCLYITGIDPIKYNLLFEREMIALIKSRETEKTLIVMMGDGQFRTKLCWAKVA